MQKIQKHIEIVSTALSDFSSMSPESRNAVQAALSKYYAVVGVTLVNDLSDLERLVELKPDLVFLGMTFLPAQPGLNRNHPDKIWLADYLDEHDVSYTGSNQTAHQRQGDKPLAKQRILDFGLSTAPFYVIEHGQVLLHDNPALEYPVFIKPTNRGGGCGIDSRSVAHNFEQLQQKVQTLSSDLQVDSLVEEFLPGREFTVAILRDEYSDEYSVMPLELVAPQDSRGLRVLTSKVKSTDTESFLAVKDQDLSARVNSVAISAFHALGARDYGRVDIRLDESGKPHFLEANLIPSLIDGYGNFPKACLLHLGLDYEDMLLQIVALGLQRNIPELMPLSDLPAIPVPA